MTKAAKKESPGLGGDGAFGKTSGTTHQNNRTRASRQGLIIGTIDKGRSAALRVSIWSHNGLDRLELRELTATIPGIYFPTSAGVMVPIENLDELLETIQKAKVEAIARGFLTGRPT